MSTNTSESDVLAEHFNEDEKVLFADFPGPPARLEPLRLPFCLPQSSAGANSSFVRAYSEELRASGVEMEHWLHFIDALNLAMSASPPLRVVDVVGMAISFVPYHWAIIAGAGLQTAAQVGIHVLAKTLTDRVLRRANAEYFAPRGLRVRICRTGAMRALVGLDAPPRTAKLARCAKAAGRTAETVALHLPVVRKVYNRLAPGVPAVDPNAPGDMTARRLLVLRDHVLPLERDVPPPAPPEGVMAKASGLSVRMQVWKDGQAEAKANHKRHLLAIQEGRATSLPPSSSLSSRSGPSQNVLGQVMEWNTARKQHREERKSLRRVHYGMPANRDLRTNVEIADRKEWNATDRLLWVVLVNAGQDTQIGGTELADGSADVESVGEAEWQEEMKREVVEDLYILNYMNDNPSAPISHSS